jgi:hypothetical protein
MPRTRNFRLFVDSSSENAPSDCWFVSLDATLQAFSALAEEWWPFAWIIEYRDQQVIGGIPTVRNVVHLKCGQQINDAPD